MVPGKVVSPTYKVTVPYFSNRNPERWIQFQKYLVRVFIDQGGTIGPNKDTKLHEILHRENFSALETHTISVEGHTKTNKSYFAAVKSVIKHVCSLQCCKHTVTSFTLLFT